MNAERLMIPDATWVAPDVSIAQAARRLAAAPAGVSCLLVGEATARPVGILTAFDILRAAIGTALLPGCLACARASGRPIGAEDLAADALFDEMGRAARATSVRSVMSSPVRCVPGTASAAQVMDLMIREKIETVPVLRGERVIGVIHRRALLAALAEAMEERIHA